MKFLQRILCMIGAAMLLAGCADRAKDVSAPAVTGGTGSGERKQLTVLCSFFPMYLFTRNVVGDLPDVRVELMVPAKAGCPHDYDLKPTDLKKIADADVFVMNGAHLEEFTDEEIKRQRPSIHVIDASHELADRHGHGDHGTKGHDHDEKGHHHEKDVKHSDDKASKVTETHDDHHGHHHHGGGNPHFFSSPKLAARQVLAIGEGLATADPKRAEQYRQNAKRYASKLNALSAEMISRSRDFKRFEIVTVHEVFDYLADDLGIDVVATLHDAPGHDPSAGQMRKLIDTIKQEKAAAIFTEPQFDQKVAATVAKDAGIPHYELDPVASGPEDAPPDYYETRMRANIDTLVKALSPATP